MRLVRRDCDCNILLDLLGHIGGLIGRYVDRLLDLLRLVLHLIFGHSDWGGALDVLPWIARTCNSESREGSDEDEFHLDIERNWACESKGDGNPSEWL